MPGALVTEETVVTDPSTDPSEPVKRFGPMAVYRDRITDADRTYPIDGLTRAEVHADVTVAAITSGNVESGGSLDFIVSHPDYVWGHTFGNRYHLELREFAAAINAFARARISR